MARDTCEWILHAPVFASWCTDPDAAVLWVSGAPGVGKSHLAAKIVDHLQRLQSPTALDRGAAKCAVASFFCDFEDTEGKDYEKLNLTTTEDIEGQEQVEPEDGDDFKHLNIILRTIAWQLIQQDKAYEMWLPPRKPKAHGAETDEKKRDDIEHLLNRDLWNWLFNNTYFASRQKASTFLVIDGLDTLSPVACRVLIKFMRELSSDRHIAPETSFKPRLKFVILGQPRSEDYMLRLSRSLRIRHITVTDKENLEDIKMYISSSLGASGKLKRLLSNEKFHAQVVEKLATAAYGDFES